MSSLKVSESGSKPIQTMAQQSVPSSSGASDTRTVTPRLNQMQRNMNAESMNTLQTLPLPVYQAVVLGSQHGPNVMSAIHGHQSSAATPAAAAAAATPSKTLELLPSPDDREDVLSSSNKRLLSTPAPNASLASAMTFVEDLPIILIGTSTFTIVGVRFCPGTAIEREPVKLKRDQQNKFEATAVDILNSLGKKIGNLSAQEAARLAPLLDQYPNVIVQATVAGPYGDSIPIRVHYSTTRPYLGQSLGALSKILGQYLQHAPGTESYGITSAPISVTAIPPIDQPAVGAENTAKKLPLPILAAAQDHETVAGQDALRVIGTIHLKIIGMEQYTRNGRAAAGDRVKLFRWKKRHTYIGVSTMGGNHIGYIPQKHADRLVPVMDQCKPLWLIATTNGERGWQRKLGLHQDITVECATSPEMEDIYQGFMKSRLKRLFKEPKKETRNY
ncbi:hypothetical protein MPSEU_000959600 [Mayamaea pseudoterrestris]|nr:hypothetical protein MPSEU_000959600 [Mayamaea pseudoterrestris]